MKTNILFFFIGSVLTQQILPKPEFQQVKRRGNDLWDRLGYNIGISNNKINKESPINWDQSNPKRFNIRDAGLDNNSEQKYDYQIGNNYDYNNYENDQIDDYYLKYLFDLDDRSFNRLISI